jgi:Protein of unknown function (DUF4239)
MLPRMDTPLAGALIVLASMLLSVIGLLLVRRLVPAEWLERHHELASYYFLTVGTIYAVLIAFAIYVVWVDFKSAATNVEHEATEVADLSRLSTAMPVESRRNITLALMEYLNAVVDDEFPAMAQGRDSKRTWAAVTRVWDIFGSLQVNDLRLQSYLNESLKHLTQLSDLRRTRLFTSHGTTPWVLWALLTVGGVLLIGFSYFVGHESVVTQGAMTACLAAVIAICMFLILSLDRPYSGIVKVTPRCFQLELNHVASRMPK